MVMLVLANLLSANAVYVRGTESEDIVKADESDLSEEEKSQKKHKYDEVNNLMSKYDGAEKKFKWLNSPEYKKKQVQKKEQSAKDAREKILNDKMAKINEELLKKTKSEEEEQSKVTDDKEKEEKEKQNSELLEQTINDNLMTMSETSDAKIITKDKAYDSAGKIIEQYKNLFGVARDNYLAEHFSTVWADHDKQCTNTIP